MRERAEIIDEPALTRVTERGATRADDRFSEAADPAVATAG